MTECLFAATSLTGLDEPVEVTAVDRGPLSVTVDEDDRTRVQDHYTVSAPLTGNVARLEPHPGDEVQADDVLARIVPLAPPLLDALLHRGMADAGRSLAAPKQNGRIEQ